MPLIKVSIQSKFKQLAFVMDNIPERVMIDLDNKLPSIRRSTKGKVKQSLMPNKHGVDTGIYKRSFVINNYAESKWQIAFQVFAKAPHYRLTHLLEDGHRSSVFKHGQGRLTRWGNKGMVDIGRRGVNVKGASQHIAEGQKYAEEKVEALMQQAINSAFKEFRKG